MRTHILTNQMSPLSQLLVGLKSILMNKFVQMLAPFLCKCHILRLAGHTTCIMGTFQSNYMVFHWLSQGGILAKILNSSPPHTQRSPYCFPDFAVILGKI